MKSRRTRFALAAAAVCTIMAVPAQAQRVADLASGAVWHVPPARTETAPAAPRPPIRDLPSALRPARVDAEAKARPLSVGGHVAVGAGAGAAAGALAYLAIFALSDDCRSPEAMCGLAIPLVVGGGAVAGGAVGLVVGLVRNH